MTVHKNYFIDFQLFLLILKIGHLDKIEIKH